MASWHIALLALAAAPSVCAAEVITVIPDRFIGEWNVRPAFCGVGADETDLLVERDRVGYYEGDGLVVAAVLNGNNELAVILKLSSEGETWLRTEHFRLSQDGSQLTSSTFGEPHIHYRCRIPISGQRPNNSFKPKPLRGSA